MEGRRGWSTGMESGGRDQPLKEEATLPQPSSPKTSCTQLLSARNIIEAPSPPRSSPRSLSRGIIKGIEGIGTIPPSSSPSESSPTSSSFVQLSLTMERVADGSDDLEIGMRVGVKLDGVRNSTRRCRFLNRTMIPPKCR